MNFRRSEDTVTGTSAAEHTVGEESKSDPHCHGTHVQSGPFTSIMTTRSCGKSTASDTVIEGAGQDENPASDNGATDEDCNNAVRVAVTNNDGRRRFDKKKFCKYCMKAVLKLPTCHII